MHSQRLVVHTSCSLACATLVLLLGSLTVLAQRRARTHSPAKYIPVVEYDPQRDAAQDLQAAIKEAGRTHKNILLEVGGQWCSWCHTLDRFFDNNRVLLALRDKNFITLKINFSEENKNQEALSKYPTITGYPHLFFLDSSGKLLRSQDTSPLESGNGYSLERLTAVLTKWGPPQ